MKKRIRSCITILTVCAMALGLGACHAAEGDKGKTLSVEATVIEIEKYGHAVLDVTVADLAAAGYELGDVVCVRFGTSELPMPFFDGYYSEPGSVLLRGTEPEDYVAVCINYGDFADVNDVGIGDTAEITMAEKAGMRALQKLCALRYSNNREDYTDDASFANFRAVTAGRIGRGKLYRTASPINNKNGRANYADDLIASVGVATVLNLADSVEDIEEYCAESDCDSTYYRSLYEAGRVHAIDLSGNFFTDDFAASVADGLTFLAQGKTPFCIHCTEGKDRAGFAAMLLEALMGAELDEIVHDYMLSFYNYYGIDKEHQPERYQAVLDTNLMAELRYVTGAESIEEMEQMDLEAAVTAYLLDAGMAQEDIFLLKEKLG